jgi:hypothetical protein
MARPDVRGVARYLPSPMRSAIGIAALGAIVSGAAAQRRRRRAAATKDPTIWATSGSTGPRTPDDG